MIIKLDGRLYRQQAVEAAAVAYADVAAVKVRAGAQWIEAEVKGERSELDEACGGDFEAEFCNHALWESGR